MNETATYNAIGQIIEPEQIEYSFNTPGWYIIFGLFLLFALSMAIIQYFKYRKNAYRREAVKEIETILNKENKSFIFEINELLKKTAIQLFGRRKVASLYGLEWFRFLNSTVKNKKSNSESLFEEFTQAIYNSEVQLNEKKVNEFVEFAILWIKNHHVKNV